MSTDKRQRKEFIVLIALGTIIGGSWLMGGYYSKAPYWMGTGGWIGGVFALFHIFTDKSLRSNNPALKPVWVLWAVFLCYVGISLLNPDYKQIEVPRGMTYMHVNSVEWLPSVISVTISAPMILQLSGSMVLAWSLLALIPSRKSIRILLLGLVLNAFVLSLVGAYFKVTGAEDILNFYRAVNSKFFASFTYHNHWVAYACFHLFLGTGLIVHYRDRFRGRRKGTNIVGLLWISCFFLFLSLSLVESRAGILVSACYLLFLMIYFVRKRLRNLLGQLKRSILLGIVLIVLGVVSYRIVSPQLTETTGRIQDSWIALFSEEKEVDNFRFNVGPRITLDLIEERPMLGWGWGSYPFAMSIFAPDYMDAMAQFAHNDWLQFISELGILGLLLFVIPIAYISANHWSGDSLTSFSRWGIALLLFIAFFEGPFTNPVVLASVLLVICLDLSVLRTEQQALSIKKIKCP